MRVPSEHHQKKVLCFLGNILSNLEIVVGQLALKTLDPVPSKRGLPMQHLIEQDSHSPYVHFMVMSSLENYLRRHILKRSADGPLKLLLVQIGCPAKIA